VLVEVLLEIEVRELLSLRDLEELAERSVRSDVVLVLEVLFLDVVVELLGHIGARDEGARGVAEEAAELIRNLGGDFEDGGAALDGLTIGIFRASTALTTTSILDFTVHALIKALDLGNHGRDGLTEGGERGENGLEVLIESRRRGSRGGVRGSGHGGSYRSSDRNNRSGDRGSRSSGLLGGLLRISSGGYNRGDRGNRSRGSNRSIVSLLGNTLGLGGRGSSSGVHHTSTGGRIHLN
jgi:hypothetical protein